MSSIPDHVRRHWQILEEIQKQTDRGVALIGAAYLEERLTEVIRSCFVPGNDPKEDLFEFSGPLGPLSAKIDIAYALGMVGPKTYRDLHLIRKIRNDFAHVADPLSFDMPPVVDRCRELYVPAHILMPGASAPPIQPRELFLAAVTIIFNLLWGEMCKRQDNRPGALNTP